MQNRPIHTLRAATFHALLAAFATLGCDVSEEELTDEELFDNDPTEEEDLSAEELAFSGHGETERATCFQNGCNGLDPATTPCASDAVTVQTKSIYANKAGQSTNVGYVQLRWSGSCQTNWARVTRTDGFYLEGMNARVTRNDGRSYLASRMGETTIWSPMVYAPNPYCARAYGLIDLSSVSGMATTNCF